MATGTIILPIPADGYDATNPARLRFEDHRWELLFEAATDEICYWTFRMPQDYSSGLTAKIQYKMAGTAANNVVFGVAVMAVSDGDAADVDTPSFDTINYSASTAVPGTAGYLDEISITLTNADSVAAGDLVSIELRRDADSTGATDDATGDAEVVAVSLEYTTT